MEWLPYVHDAIEYIEDNLLTIQNTREVSDALGMSEVHLQKGFHILTGYSIAEYIRNRRMYEAALEIVSTDKRLADLALKYGYEAQDAFTKSFIRFHGLTPGTIRKKGDGYRTFLPIKVDLVVKGGINSRLKTMKKYPFTLIGYQRKVDDDESVEEIRNFWEEFYEKYYDGFEDSSEINENVSLIERYGIGEYGLLFKDDNSYIYMIAGKYTGGKVPSDMTLKEISGGEWAVFDYSGPVIGFGKNKADLCMGKKWIEEDSDYVAVGEDYIEWYESLEEEKNKDGYRSALWIPVKRKEKDDKTHHNKRNMTLIIGISCVLVLLIVILLNGVVKKHTLDNENGPIWEKYNHNTASDEESGTEYSYEYNGEKHYYDSKLEGELLYEYNRIIEMIPEDLRGGGYLERLDDEKDLLLHIYIKKDLPDLPEVDRIEYELVKYSLKDLKKYMMILNDNRDELGIQNMGIREPLNKIVIYDWEELDINVDRINELIPEDAYTLIFQGGGIEEHRNINAFGYCN